MKRDEINALIGIVLIVGLFILASYVTQRNLEYIRGLIGGSYFSIVVYVLIAIFATVVAPVSSVPLIPVAVSVWGWFLTAILSIAGWFIGSLIAFWLARKYGVPLVRKFISLEKIEKFEKMIPEKHIFWSIVFLRMSIPVDILSYVLGLFSQIRFRTYAIATLIGILPFAFALAYIGALPFYYQIIAFMIGLMILLVGVLIALFVKGKKRKAHKPKPKITTKSIVVKKLVSRPIIKKLDTKK